MSNENFYYAYKKYNLSIETHIYSYVYLMSIFESFKEWAIIENPSQLKQHKDYVKKEKEKKKKTKEDKQREEMKANLTPEEYERRYQKQWRDKNKKKKHELYIVSYAKQKEERDIISEEVLSEIEYKWEKEQTIDEYYINKFKEEDTDWEWRYRYSWRASPLAKLDRRRVVKYDRPIRITENYWNINILIKKQLSMQWDIYKLIYPRLNEIPLGSFKMSPNQKVTARPMWNMTWRILELAEESWYPKHQICEITWALQKGIYIPSEVYLWHISWIFWETIITSMGHMFKIALENNLKWLTPDTIEDVRQQRLNYKKKWDKCRIYVLLNAYLIRVPNCKIYEKDWIKNYWHYSYYVVPMWNKFIN